MNKNLKYILLWSLLLVCFLTIAQGTGNKESTPEIDSLQRILKNLSSSSPEIKLVKGSDTIRVNILTQLSRQYMNMGSYEQAMQYALEAQKQSERLNYQKGLSSAYSSIGLIYMHKGNYENALVNSLKALKIREAIEDKELTASSYNSMGIIYQRLGSYEMALTNHFMSLTIRQEIGDDKGIAMSYNNIGIVYWNQGNYEKALSNYLKSLVIQEKIGNKEGKAQSYNNIGLIYDKLEDYEKAIGSYLECLENMKEIGNKVGIATSYNNIGIVYAKLDDYEKSLDNFMKSLKIREEIGDKKGVLDSYNNISNVYLLKYNNYEKALDNTLKALKISEEIGDKQGMATSYQNVGNIYTKQNKFEESYYYLSKSLVLSKEIGAKDALKATYFFLSGLFEKQGNYKQALEYNKLYSDIKDTLLNEVSNKQITEMNTKYESEKKEKDIQLLTKDKELQHAEIGRQKLIRNGFVGGLVLALLLALIIFNRFQITRKQKKIIEFQNAQIVESINYSKKIQDSLLPSIESMEKAVPGLFVFYEPKNIVSGDFYFFKEFKNYILLACVDCTGHGVPGGFMSTLGNLLLDKITNDESQKPSEILTQLNDEIIRILHQQSGGELQDGMDLSVCLIDRHNRKIEFSGARNGIIVVTNGEAKRYKASPLPVGGNYMKKGVPLERNFQTQSISLNATDLVYMYTDGFIEQLGGTQGLPMSYEQFERHLLALSGKKSASEKIDMLQAGLNDWKGNNDLTDDILVIGFNMA